MSLGVLRRPTLVTVVVVSSYGGRGKGLLWFLVACPSSSWLSSAALGDVGSILFGRHFCAVTSHPGYHNDIIIDAHTDGSRTDGHFWVTSDVMGRDVTSG